MTRMRKRHGWLGFGARIDAVLHKIRHPKHEVRWRANADEYCPGDITCETCGCIFWCRAVEKERE